VNFFEAQDHARRVSRRLIVLFVVAVAGLIVLTEVLVISTLYLTHRNAAAIPVSHDDILAFAATLDGSVHVTIVSLILLVVGLGAWSKSHQLRAGGYVVATLMDGRLVPGNSDDPAQRRLLNVVEEMAIAAGVPVPQVYVMARERGINAFAAGLGSDDAVICVTQGMLEALDRPALQGVIGHEFSHILNGDMRMNATVTSVLHGILILGLAGMRLLRVVGYRRRSSRESAAIVVLGAGLVVIGFCGMFFGSLIKAMVNRQREYLADASAVQFTRNPAGIATALKVIGGYSYGSRVLQPNSAEVSHFFFARATTTWLQSLFATHPPLVERIRRLDPHWNGHYPRVDTSYTRRVTSEELADASAVTGDRRPTAAAVLMGLGAMASAVDPDARSGQQVLESLPAALSNAARDPFLARTLIFALLLSDDTAARQRQVRLVATSAEPGIDRYLLSLYTIVGSLARVQRLPLVSLALPSLRACSARQIERFVMVMKRIIRDDMHISLYEWCLATIVINGVRQHALARPSQLGNRHLRRLSVQVRLILSLLAQAVDSEQGPRERAYAAALEQLQISWQPPCDKTALRFESVDHALTQLDRLRPLDKQRLLDACHTLIGYDHDIDVAEGEVLRAIAAALHCPLPAVPDGLSSTAVS
jgi:Zn-dependent protease with chaperone function